MVNWRLRLVSPHGVHHVRIRVLPLGRALRGLRALGSCLGLAPERGNGFATIPALPCFVDNYDIIFRAILIKRDYYFRICEN